VGTGKFPESVGDDNEVGEGVEKVELGDEVAGLGENDS
jgi:hypothetical protein